MRRSASTLFLNNATGKNANSTFEGRQAVVSQEVTETKPAEPTIILTPCKTFASEKPNADVNASTQPQQSVVLSSSLLTSPLQRIPTQILSKTKIQHQPLSLSFSLPEHVLETLPDLREKVTEQNGLRGNHVGAVKNIAETVNPSLSLSTESSAQNLGAVTQSFVGVDSQKLFSEERCTIALDGSRLSPFCDEKWNRLPPVTVSFASSPPLPHVRRENDAETEKTTLASLSKDPLPLLSHVIRLPSGKLGTNPQYGNGVKVLLKEKPRHRTCRSAFFNELKVPEVTHDPSDNYYEQRAIKRREDKRFNEIWGPARIMSTLMKWKAPRLSSASHVKTDTNLSDNKDEIVELAVIEKLQNIHSPVFIPLSLGINSPVSTFHSKSLSENKVLAIKLRGEMEEMKAKLQTELRKKQLFMTQERIESESASNSKSHGMVVP